MIDTMVRKWRRDSEGVSKPGPYHVMASYDLTWCGRRMRGILDRRPIEGTTLHDGDRMCQDCRRAQEQGKPRSWRRYR